MSKKQIKRTIPDIKETLQWLALELMEKDEKSGIFLPGNRYPGKHPQDFLLFLQEDSNFLCALPEIAATMLFPNNEISRGITFLAISGHDSEYINYLTCSKFWWKYIQECERVTKQAIVAGIIARQQHLCYQSFSSQAHDKGKSAKFAHYIVNNKKLKEMWGMIFNDDKLPLSHAKKAHTEYKYVLHFLASFAMIKGLMFANKSCKHPMPSIDVILRTFLAFSYEHYRFRRKEGIEGWLPSNFYTLLEMFEIDSMMVGFADFEPTPNEFLTRELDEYIQNKAYQGV